MEIQLCGWNTSLQPVGTRAECSMRKHQHYFSSQMLSVFNSQWNCLPLHFLCASQLSKKDNVVDVWEETTVILARKLARRNDRTSRCSPVHCHLSMFLHGMNATFSASALSNDEGSFRWVVAASLLVRKTQNPERNSSFLIFFPEFPTTALAFPWKVDLVLIQTSLLLLCKSSRSYAN